MARIDDVAAAVIARTGPVSAMKLQKLVYYCQAWHLVWDDEPLFRARIEAWANGPVAPALYKQHRGQFRVTKWSSGDARHLRSNERETVDAVIDHYGPMSAGDLSELTHNEAPWRDARRNLPPGSPSTRVISAAAMAEFYGGLIF